MRRLRPVGLLGWGAVVLLCAAILAVVGVIGVISSAGGGVLEALGSPVVSTPTSMTRTLTPGTYVVFELVGTSQHVGPLTTTQSHFVTLRPDQVTVTSPTGATVPVEAATDVETLTRGNGIFRGAAQFDVVNAGTYQVAVTASGLEVVLGPSVLSSLGRSVGWLLTVGVGVLLGILGFVLLIVGFFRLRRRPSVPVVALSGVGWFADPWQQARLRWWDGHQWTGHTQP